MNLKTGTIIAGSYRVDRRIGAGGMGEVWSGVRLADDRSVALKLLLTGAEVTGEVLARFRREAQVLALVRSNYVAEVLDFVMDDDFGFVLALDLIPGESLHAKLGAQGRMTVEATLDIVSDVLRGLRDLHAANIVHRDLKPGNIVLRPRPNLRPRATLIDFGVSRIMSNPDEEEVTAITRGDRVLGTLEYMAPEQILGSRTVTGTADLYAVGAIMFRAIAGHHIFGDLQEGHLAVAKLNEDAPALPTGRDDPLAQRVATLVSRLLSRRLRDRYENAEQVIAEVDEIRALARVRVAAPDTEVTDDTTLETNFTEVDGDAISISSPDIYVPRQSRAAIPMDSEHPKSRRGPPPLPQQAAGPSTPPPSAEAEGSGGGAPPGDAGGGPNLPRKKGRPVVLGVILFIVGSAGGGLFGVSYSARGAAYQWVSHAKGWVGIAPPPAVVVAPPVPSATAPVPSPQQFNLDEVPVPAGATPGETDPEAETPPAASSSAAAPGAAPPARSAAPRPVVAAPAASGSR